MPPTLQGKTPHVVLRVAIISVKIYPQQLLWGETSMMVTAKSRDLKWEKPPNLPQEFLGGAGGAFLNQDPAEGSSGSETPKG